MPPDLVDAGHYQRIERRRGIAWAAGTTRQQSGRQRACNNKVTSESDADTCTISFASNRPRNDGFYSTSLISSAFGSRYLIRKEVRTEVRRARASGTVQGVQVRDGRTIDMAAVSSVATRLTASIAGSAVRSLVTATATLQQ